MRPLSRAHAGLANLPFPLVAKSELQSGGLANILDFADVLQDRRRHGAVDRYERDRRTARLIPSERESCDIDARLSQETGEPADKARLVLIRDVNHRGREFRIDLYAFDRQNARLAVLE